MNIRKIDNFSFHYTLVLKLIRRYKSTERQNKTQHCENGYKNIYYLDDRAAETEFQKKTIRDRNRSEQKKRV